MSDSFVYQPRSTHLWMMATFEVETEVKRLRSDALERRMSYSATRKIQQLRDELDWASFGGQQ